METDSFNQLVPFLLITVSHRIYSKEIPVNIRVSSLPVPRAGLENFRYKELNAMT